MEVVIKAILPFELYYSRNNFISVEGHWLILDLKRYGVIDFTHYWSAFHWIGSKLYENECCCYKFRCQECKTHWWEIFCESNYLFGIYGTLFSPYGVLRSNLKRQLSQSVLKLVYSFGYTEGEYTAMNTYTVKELKNSSESKWMCLVVSSHEQIRYGVYLFMDKKEQRLVVQYFCHSKQTEWIV